MYKAEKEIIGCCVLIVKVATTGYMGGDCDYGGRTSIELAVDGGEMGIEIDSGRRRPITIGPITEFKKVETVKLKFGGDEELRTLIEGLEFAVESLKSGIRIMGNKNGGG